MRVGYDTAIIILLPSVNILVDVIIGCVLTISFCLKHAYQKHIWCDTINFQTVRCLNGLIRLILIFFKFQLFFRLKISEITNLFTKSIVLAFWS